MLIVRYGNRADTAASWAEGNPTLALAEYGFELNSVGAPVAYKIGPGRWNDLPRYEFNPSAGAPFIRSSTITRHEVVTQAEYDAILVNPPADFATTIYDIVAG